MCTVPFLFYVFLMLRFTDQCSCLLMFLFVFLCHVCTVFANCYCSFVYKPLCSNMRGPSWLWSDGSWNYLCHQCISPPMWWVRISIRARCTPLCDKVDQWLATGRCFFPGPPVSSTNKTDRHDITQILLNLPLNTIKQTNKQANINHEYRWLMHHDVIHLCL
jgi:hypothetical protein